MKNENTVCGVHFMNAGNGQIRIKCEFIVRRKVLVYWLRFSAATLLSVLIALNVPGVEHIMHQLLV